MKKRVVTAVSAGVILTMVGGYSVMANTVFSNNKKEATEVADNREQDKKEENPIESIKDGLSTDKLLSFLNGDSKVDKQETVYVIADADGTAKKVIVTEMLNNADKKDKLEDKTGLSNIINTRNDSAYTAGGDGIVWDAAGDTVYYRGDTEAELPVSFGITYKLDGEEITADKLAGKSGELEMTFNYHCVASQKVIIDEKETEIFVPFVMLSGTIVNNDVFKNIEVSNGKVINDGDKSIVVGFALPGLNENLGFENKIFHDSFTIKADVTNFEMTTTLTMATNDIFNHFGFDGLPETSDVDEMIAALTDKVNALVSGISQLAGGLNELDSKVGVLSSGITTVIDSVTKLKDGAATLYSGLTTVDSKLVELSKGLTKLSENSASLNAGAKKVFGTLLSQVQSQLDAAGLAGYGINVPKLTIENYSDVLTGLLATLKKYGMNTAAIDGAKASLDEYNVFYSGLAQYTAGVDSAAAGSVQLEQGVSAQLVPGSKTLSDGLSQFATGINGLVEKLPQLTEGISKLKDGANTLSDAVNRLYSDGVQKMVAEIADIRIFVKRVEATLDVSAAYQSFGGKAEDMTGKTKFIYRTESISNN